VFVPNLLAAYYSPDPNTKRSTYIFGGIDCCSGGFVVVLCKPESKLFLVIYQVHRFIGITGNERTDAEAKQAAQGRDSSEQRDLPPGLRGTLPWSKSAVRQSLNAHCQADREKLWKKSHRYECTVQYDTRLLKGSYLELADCLPQSLAVLVMQLRTGHVPLAKHLHRICKADSPLCPCCRQADETVAHYLVHCPEHLRARQELYRAAGPDAHVLSKLLGSPKMLPHLCRYLGRTGRFHTVHGTLLAPPDPKKLTYCEKFKQIITAKMPSTFPRTADPFNADLPPGFFEDWAALQAALAAAPDNAPDA
jgi:hypothetical protein